MRCEAGARMSKEPICTGFHEDLDLDPIYYAIYNEYTACLSNLRGCILYRYDILYMIYIGLAMVFSALGRISAQAQS